MELAELGLSVRSDGVVVAARRLDKMTTSSKRAETATERLVRQTKRMSAQAAKMGRSMSMFVTLPILALGTVAIRVFENFDDAMIASQAIMGDLADTVKKEMTAVAREMGETTVFSATQAAESYFFLASAGLSAAASIAALPRVAAFAQAGNFDMAKATDILTDAQSALGKVMEDPLENMREMVKLSDILVKANTVANASVQQFGEALTNKAGTAMKQLNIDVETGVAVLAAWADQGVKATEAGEKFNIVTRDLQAAVRKNAEVFDSYNIKVFDNEGALRNMADIIGDLERALGPMSVQQQGATLALLGFQDRSVIAIRSLLGLSEKIRDYEKDLRSAGDITEEVAKKQLESFSKKTGLLKAVIADFGIEIGASLAPVYLKLLTVVSDATNAIGEMSPKTKTLILQVIGLVAAIGPLLAMMGMMFMGISGLTMGVTMFSAAIATKLLPALVSLSTILIGPVGVVIALGVLVKLFGDVYIAKLEAAIGVTGRFTTSLKEMDQVALQSNLDTANEQLTLFMDDRENQLARLANITAMMNDTEVLSSPGALPLLEKQLADLNIEMDETSRFIDQQTRLRDSYVGRIEASAAAIKAEADALAQSGKDAEDIAAAIKLTADEVEALTEWWSKLRAEMDPATVAAENYQAAIALLDLAIANGVTPAEQRAAAIKQLHIEMRDASGATDKFLKSLERVSKVKLVSLDGIKALRSLEAIIDPAEAAAQRLAAALALLKEAQDDIGFSDDVYDRMADGLERAIIGATGLADALQRSGAMAGEVLRSIQSSMTNGSKAYEAMNIAIQAANVVQAIGAVLSQAQGDPYTAFARMAAMAAAVAALGVSIGSFGGGFTDTAAERQGSQGTGSVLGDAEAKSESILNAMEITASATSELVGINSGMLRALQSLNAGLSGASGALARNPQGGEFGALPNTDLSGAVKFAIGGPAGLLLDKLFGGVFSKIVNAIFGGKSKVTDEGIAILAGTLNDAIGGTLLKAFQEVKFKKWIFGSTKTREELIALGDSASKQIGLIFQAIGDTVREGALALGLDAEEIQTAMDAFRIEEIRISLKDLSAEEAQAELQAVFSKIFDDLAESVIPFLGQFQKVGEGLGETLIRVATSVQVMQEAVKQLGLSVNETDPEKFAQMSVALIELVGGVDAFISKLKNFVSKFATDAHKLKIATEALTNGFASVGLTLPDTADGLWDLMQSLDATTESGRRQIAMILELTDYADTYFNLRGDILDMEVEALLRIQSIAQGVVATLSNLRDMIIGDISTPEQNYQKAREEAEKLAAALATMTDPDQINETVRRIEQLTRGAYGILDEGQKAAMAQQFLTFIDQVQALALERLGVSADEALANTEFTPEEILARFNDRVTDPLILVAQLQESAALKLVEAAEYLMGRTPADFSIQPGPSDAGPIANPDTIAQDISVAVQAGMQAGAQAMAEAAASIVVTSSNSDATSKATAQAIARAITSIPSRIVVEHTESEFS